MEPKQLDVVSSASAEVDRDTALPRARYAILLRPLIDRAAEARRIQAVLAPIHARVEPFLLLDPDILIVSFPHRVFVPNDAVVFESAYVLQDGLGCVAVEPDLPTNVFPEPDRVRAADDPETESVSSLCFTAEQQGLDPNWALDSMNVRAAWTYSTNMNRPDRGADVVIAQPDTGITSHPELDQVAIVNPRDVIDGDIDPTDPLSDIGNPGHGTGTASVAISPETGVITGSAPRAKHMPIRAIRSVVRITQVSVAEAIDWAVANGGQVITMSLGGIPSFALHRAVRRAVAADLIVLAAAGNCVRTVVWPARYDDCIAVAGVNSSDQPWLGTCRGAAVDVSAPGENVFRAQTGNPPVGQGQGTSFAVALTAGVAALWLAHHGRANLIAAARARGESVQTMFRRLVRGTARRPDGWDSFEMGAGIVDARALLAADLDLNRGLESVPQEDRAEVRGVIAIQSLVLETLGETALDSDLDWERYGPEVATAILKSQLAKRRGNLESAMLTSNLSAHLAAADGSKAIFSHLRAVAL